MNFGALFDQLSADLADGEVAEQRGADGERLLSFEGVAFARLSGEHMAFRLPPGSLAHNDALALRMSAPTDDGWVEVAPEDVSEWPRLAESALAGLRRR